MRGSGVAAGASTISGSSSRTVVIRSRAAAAERKVLYSWESCCTGSKKFARYSVKASSVPTVRLPSTTRAPEAEHDRVATDARTSTAGK